MKYFFILVLIILFSSFLSHSRTFGQSEYMLPYPSVMPGNFRYKAHLLLEEVQKYWYFGNFSQFKYNLKQTDKYIVEAKTLFEYGQFLLGYSALKKSNSYFLKAKVNLIDAKSENRNTAEKKEVLKNAGLKHAEILRGIKQSTPENFLWTPENDPATQLKIHQAINTSIELRK